MGGLRPTIADEACIRPEEKRDERPRTLWREAGHALIPLVALGGNFVLIQTVDGRGARVHSVAATSRETDERRPLETRER
jgi:hypothetical protein